MATSREYIEFVMECIPENRWEARYKKMFGEYMVYLNGKPVLLVCDDTVFVKMLPELSGLMTDASAGVPYEGAKEHYILDIEDREKCERVLEVLESITPLPEKRVKK